MLRTEVACHCPPRGALIPRAFRASAICRFPLELCTYGRLDSCLRDKYYVTLSAKTKLKRDFIETKIFYNRGRRILLSVVFRPLKIFSATRRRKKNGF
jgi:hypothetical protein